MTLFQARFIQWLVLHVGCSLRATAGNYYGRYDRSGKFRGVVNDYEGWDGNQLDGILLSKKAIQVLKANGAKPYFTVCDYELDEYRNWRAQLKRNRKNRGNK